MIQAKFDAFKVDFNQYSKKEVRQFFIRENPNNLIAYLSDQPYFKEHFCWNGRLNEKHIPYMLENGISIKWYPLSISEEISFHYIMKTWRRRHLGLYHDWSVTLLATRKDLTLEFRNWLLKRNIGWRYDYVKLSKAEVKEEERFTKRPFHDELLFRPPYSPDDPFAKPCFKYIGAIEYHKSQFSNGL